MNAQEFELSRAWHESRNPQELCTSLEAVCGYSIQDITKQLIEPTAPRAVFLTGSVPLGMATRGSDVDLIILIDSKEALLTRIVDGNTLFRRQLAFSNETDPLRAGLYFSVLGGITVEVAVVITPAISRVYKRLRSSGPELSEMEIMVLGRLRTGWLISQSEGYLKQRQVELTDPILDVYCSVKHFLTALGYRHKALHAMELSDIPQALHLGRLAVESAYLAYFASQGLTYLGPKWLAQLGHGRDAESRVQREPLLKEHLRALFPVYESGEEKTQQYLRVVSQCLTSIRTLIERETRFRIAYKACRQIYPIT